MLKKVLFIYNPSSGEDPIYGYFDTIVSLYQRHGYSLTLHRLTFGDADHEIISGAGSDYDHMLIAGGDGSVNYVVNLLMKYGNDTHVAILPAGTANDFATAIGMPQDISQACHAILEGRRGTVDIGKVNDRYFVNVFSCGLFTDVSQKTPTTWKNDLGRIAYYINGIGDLPRFRKMELSIRTDGGDYEGKAVIFFVFNGRTAGTLPIAYLSEASDGLLDVLILKGDTPAETLRTVIEYLPRMLRRKEYPAGMVHIRCNSLHAESSRDENTDIDGQPGPSFPIDITCLHDGLHIILPENAG